ncbi:MAG: phytanoyl-CoA dioxygenase [Chitinophagaceae bacterium]|nr:MAG: phytanoyl-CoA dioxygenase [Chitinophagaceae bacterium]
MHHPNPIQEALSADGYCVLNNVFPKESIQGLTDLVESFASSAEDLFAIRRFFLVVPGAVQLIFSSNFIDLVANVFGTGYFVSKSIYFDKTPSSNWFVAWHQDLTISVDKRIEAAGFGPWTIKENQFSVRPPLAVLEDNFTLRIHLDDTDHKNGALKVIPGSHLEGIVNPQSIIGYTGRERVCEVEKGGVMFMKPLLLHASGRCIDSRRRRVIHIEFSRTNLPAGIQWSEFLPVVK